ncbi:MAG: class I SAM-dependent methyltransferase [Acidobacteriota bacterium]|nr:class I SAM-dependent methyltransferase [Acidobacteriota bacterium]
MNDSLRNVVKASLDWISRTTKIQIWRDENRFYSPIPTHAELKSGRQLWDRPSEMIGVHRDVAAMRQRLERLMATYRDELEALDDYYEVKKKGLGEGFTILDSFLLYAMLRDLKPRRMIEIGAGFCTYYSSSALQQNAEEGRPCAHTVIEPNPWQGLRDVAGDLVAKPAQEVPLETFAELEEGDVLFIDTTHMVKIGGEVVFLYLEVIPRLKPGVVVHAHDIHFPHNTPYPAERYIFKRLFPWLFTEAALLQAFLAFNNDYEIRVSNSMIRHDDQLEGVDSLSQIPGCKPLEWRDFDTHYGSIWFQRKVPGQGA